MLLLNIMARKKNEASRRSPFGSGNALICAAIACTGCSSEGYVLSRAMLIIHRGSCMLNRNLGVETLGAHLGFTDVLRRTSDQSEFWVVSTRSERGLIVAEILCCTSRVNSIKQSTAQPD